MRFCLLLALHHRFIFFLLCNNVQLYFMTFQSRCCWQELGTTSVLLKAAHSCYQPPHLSLLRFILSTSYVLSDFNNASNRTRLCRPFMCLCRCRARRNDFNVSVGSFSVHLDLDEHPQRSSLQASRCCVLVWSHPVGLLRFSGYPCKRRF
jgi:hypothetical protein